MPRKKDLIKRSHIGSSNGKSTGMRAQANYEKAIAIARDEIWQDITSGKAGSGSIAIMEGGKIIYAEGFGMADREKSIPVDPNTLFNIGSVSKAFAATAIMMLVDQGKIKLDDSAVKYLPEFILDDPRYKDITVRMLLNHTSGIPGSTFANNFGCAYNTEILQETLDNLSHSHLKYTPGAIPIYCNDGFTLVEMIIESVSGQKYIDFLSQNIFQPLSLTSSGLSVGQRPGKTAAVYYKTDTGKKEPLQVVSLLGAGGLGSTPSDLCRFADTFSGRGTQILSKTALDEITKEQPSGLAGKLRNPEASFGLGWDTTYVPQYQSQGIKVMSKSGGTVDYTTWLLTAPILDLYRRSLITMRVQIDNRGAIIASTDSDITEVLGDTYSYVWGRDGAFVAKALDMANYDEVSHEFFNFCANIITSEGYLLHKYTADGSLAGQWMPWADEEGKLQLPIEEDETALVIYSLWHHYDKFHDVEHIRSLYRKLIMNAADFMASYREPHTNLPAPSYDLWEERRGIHSFTVAAVWAGLQAAANSTEMLGEIALTKKYRQAAAEIKEAAIEYLFDKKLGRFLRSIRVDANGTVEPDYIIDSSICGLFLFGMLQATDPRIESTMAALIDRLWCKTEVGGVARYENDCYQQISQDITNVPGNPWFICTMWVAQYYIAKAQSVDDLKPALQILHWAQRCALRSGILAEQVHPYCCTPLSVSPLSWSHAAIVIVVHEYIDKYHELRAQLQHKERVT